MTALFLVLLPGARGSAAEWAGFRGDSCNSAWQSITGCPAPGQDWSLRPSAQVRSYANETGVFGSPAVCSVEGQPTLLVGSYDHNVYAVDVATGRERWRFSTGGPVYGTPCVVELADRPVAFVGSSDRVLYALDARDGTKLWARELVGWRATVGQASLASPASFQYRGQRAVLLCAWVHDRSATQPIEEALAAAYGAEDGRLLWRLPLGASELASPTVAQEGGQWLAVVGAGDGKVYGLDLSRGKVLWRRVLRGQVVGSAGLLTGVGRDLALIGSRFGTLHALDLHTGEDAWSFRTAQAIDSTPAIAQVGGVWTAFFGSTDQSLYAVAALTGDGLWTFRTRGDVYSSPTVFRDHGRDLVAFTAGDDRLYLLDAASGVEQWSVSPGEYLWGYRVTGDSVWSSPVAVGLSGTTVLLLPFYDGVIHAYRVSRKPPQAAGPAPGYGRQMVLRAALVMMVTAALCAWLTRKRGSG